jgi:protein-tyrosine phosphatase
MIDLHCHVLAGIDDGPADADGSLEMLRAAEAAGITTVLATPHVSARYPNDHATIAEAAAALAERRRDEELAIEVLAGAEVALTRVAEIEPAELELLRLGGGPWLLAEPPFSTVAPGLQSIVADLQRRGHRVLIAHPERCPAFQRRPDMLEALIDTGALSSLTAGSLVGRFGSSVQRFAVDLLDRGLAHNVASDAHDVGARPPSIAAELRAAGAQDLEDWLTREVPGAILSGAEIPPRPPTSFGSGRGRGRRWRLSRSGLRRAS